MAQDNLSLDHNLGEGACVRREDEEVGQRDQRRHWYMPRTPIAMEDHSEVDHMNRLLRVGLSVLGEDKEGQPHKQQNRESAKPRGNATLHRTQAMPIAREDREEADHPSSSHVTPIQVIMADDPSTRCCAVARTIVGSVASHAYLLLFPHNLRSPFRCLLNEIKRVGLGKAEFGRVYNDGHCGS